MLIAGFDCSTKSIACVILDENRQLILSKFIESKKNGMDLRLQELVEQLECFGDNELFDNAPSLIIVENPVFLNNVKASSGIAQVVGCVKSLAVRVKAPFLGIDNKVWKKSAIGNGNASKDEIMSFAKYIWGDKIVNQDLADSACLALFGVLRSPQSSTLR